MSKSNLPPEVVKYIKHNSHLGGVAKAAMMTQEQREAHMRMMREAKEKKLAQSGTELDSEAEYEPQ